MQMRLAAALFAAALLAPAAARGVEAAPKDPPKAEPSESEALTAKVNALYKGKVVRFDPKTLALELLYEFKNEKEAQDLTLSNWAFADKKGSFKVADGGCRLLGTNQVALVPGRFSSVAAEVDFATLTNGASAAPCLTVCSDGAGNFYEIVGFFGGNAGLQRCVAGGFAWLGQSVPSPFARERRGSMSISFEKGRIKARVGKQAFEAEDASLTAGQVGLRAYEADIEFRNLRISGTLERAWVDKLMGKAPPPEEAKPATPPPPPPPPPDTKPKPKPEDEGEF